MSDVEAKEQRDVKSRLLHRDCLIAIDLVGIDNVEQGADLPVGNHVVVVGAASPGPGRLAGRILHQLSHLLFERHALKNLFYLQVKIFVRDAIGDRGGARSAAAATGAAPYPAKCQACRPSARACGAETAEHSPMAFSCSLRWSSDIY